MEENTEALMRMENCIRKHNFAMDCDYSIKIDFRNYAQESCTAFYNYSNNKIAD